MRIKHFMYVGWKIEVRILVQFNILQMEPHPFSGFVLYNNSIYTPIYVCVNSMKYFLPFISIHLLRFFETN